MNKIELEKRLKDLENDDNFKALLNNLREEEFNIFRVLKLVRKETRHSEMLAWLFNPKGSHGLGEAVLKDFIGLVKERIDDSVCVPEKYDDFKTYREHEDIDVLVVSDENKLVLCIENKIDSGEVEGQLNKYRTYVDENFEDYTRVYIFLSPDGREPSDMQNWRAMEYASIVSILRGKREDVNRLSSGQAQLINDYLRILESDIVANGTVKELCAKIYRDYQDVIETIIENKPDKLSLLTEDIGAWCREKSKTDDWFLYDPKYTTKSMIRFTTEKMDSCLPPVIGGRSAWSTYPEHFYFYEINLRQPSAVNVKLVLSPKGMAEDKLRWAQDTFGDNFKREQNHCTVKSSKIAIVDEHTSFDDIKPLLENQLNQFVKEVEEKI